MQTVEKSRRGTRAEVSHLLSRFSFSAREEFPLSRNQRLAAGNVKKDAGESIFEKNLGRSSRKTVSSRMRDSRSRVFNMSQSTSCQSAEQTLIFSTV